MLQRLEKLLSHPRAPWGLGLFAFLISLPAVRFGLQADDLVFPWLVERGTPPWAMFEIDPSAVGPMREQGSLVWWSSPETKALFFRPLSSLWHALDFTLWSQAAWLMHLTNAILYGLEVALAAQLYRRFAPSLAVAGLAGLLFAIDEGHAFSAGWIAGRNTLLAALFALLALELHARARASGRLALYAASTLSVALALCSAEAGVWALTMLASYALVFEPGGLLARVRTLIAPLCVGLAWAGVYVALGCGLRGSSFYRDPSDPLHALSQGLFDLPVWFGELFGPSAYPFSLFHPPLWVRLGYLPAALALLWLLWPGLRRSREGYFFALSSALAFAPLICTIPTSRVLIGPSFGAMGWVACAIAQARADGDRAGRIRTRALLTIHLFLSLLLFFPSLGSMASFVNGTAQLVAAAAPGKDLIVLQAPMELLSNYAMVELTTEDRVANAPHSVQELYTGSSELWVTRVDARTLEIEATRGWGYSAIERIFCKPEHMPRAGSEVKLAAFSARVLNETAQGMPAKVRFTFPTPLEGRERKWGVWIDNRVRDWTPPRVGERVRIAPLSFFTAMQP